MKKIIALLAATIMCAGIFVGCGSSNAAHSLPGHADISLESSRDTFIDKLGLEPVKDKFGNVQEDEFITQEGTPYKIGKTNLPCAMFEFNENKLSTMCCVTDDVSDKNMLKNDFDQLKKDLTETYGEPEEVEKEYSQWIIDSSGEDVFKLVLEISTSYSNDQDHYITVLISRDI